MHVDLVAALNAGRVLSDVGRSVREGFFMFWETFWALVLGFTLSGMVQAFVSKDQMRAKLGNHRPAAVGRAAGYGMVSSSCSYAASAMSKSLFAKGADFVSAMIFMVASTNLVVELGIVMLVLLGWQFMAAEFVGGPIMIVLLALAGGYVFRGPLVSAARSRLSSARPGDHDHMAMTGVSEEQQAQLDRTAWTQKFHSRAAWADAASYAKADVTMLRKELVIGYAVAGFLATLVPRNFWNLLFIHGHGFWTSVENALVGPLIAVVSWVCSIGNVPLAAALWSGGISFGGVIAFIFADLIAMPLILIYRKFYGNPLTLRLVGLFYAVMSIAGLVTEELFRAFHLVPNTRTFKVPAAHFEWNYTTFLNFAFIGIAVVVWWLARHQALLGGGLDYAIDPVCSMQVRVSDAPAHTVHEQQHFYFCSDRCRDRFEERPERYSGDVPRVESMEMNLPKDQQASSPTAIDPVCGMTVEKATAAARRTVDGADFWFCNTGCAEAFDASPGRFLVAN